MKSHTFITKWSVLFPLNFYPWKNIRILSQTRPLPWNDLSHMFILRVVIILWVRITFSRSSSHVMEIVPKKPWRKEAILSGPCTWEFSSGPSSKGLCGPGLVPSKSYGEVGLTGRSFGSLGVGPWRGLWSLAYSSSHLLGCCEVRIFLCPVISLWCNATGVKPQSQPIRDWNTNTPRNLAGYKLTIIGICYNKGNAD